MEQSVAVADPFVSPVQESAFASDPYPAYGAPVSVEASYETPAAATASTQRYHTVVRHDTLFGLARSYYGDARRWKDIYEANRSLIPDPNKIRVGQRLLIP